MFRLQVFVRPWKLVRILDFLSFLYLLDMWSRLWHKHTVSVTDSFSILFSENGWYLKTDEVCSNGLSWLQLIHSAEIQSNFYSLATKKCQFQICTNLPLLSWEAPKGWKKPKRKGASLVAQMVKNLLAVWETWVQSLGWKDPGRRKWQPTPVVLPGKSYRERSNSTGLPLLSWEAVQRVNCWQKNPVF